MSLRALQQVGDIAPGWDKYYLEAAYKNWVAGLGEMPRDADAAFLGVSSGLKILKNQRFESVAGPAD